jgi:uncharacterized protein YjlB
MPTDIHGFSRVTDLPLVIHRGALKGKTVAQGKRLFARNRWTGAWENGIYAYHHYHADTHEVLGIIRGRARVQFGGKDGPILTVRAGDVVVIPAGISHKRESAAGNLLVIGAYPGEHEPEHEPDIRRGAAVARGRARKRPAAARPEADPVFGRGGKLFEYWR